MMKALSALSYFEDSLLPYFEHKRYKFVPGCQQFRRDTNFGFSSATIHVSPADDGVFCEFHVGVRYSKVECFLAEVLPHRGYYLHQSHTLMVNWADVWPDALLRRYYCSSEEELDGLADIFVDFMDIKGFDFLDLYRNAATLAALFNDFPDNPLIRHNQGHQKYFRALGLARFTGRPDYRSLYDRNRQYLCQQGFDGSVVQKFDSAYLKLGPTIPNTTE